MTVGQFVGSLGEPIEAVVCKMDRIQERVEMVVQDEKAATPEFIAALKESVDKGQVLFQAVTQAAAHRGDNWQEDDTAKQSVADFLVAFKSLDDATSKAFETVETEMVAEGSEPDADDDGAAHDAAAQVATENQDLNKEQTENENDDATLTAAEHEAAAPGNDENRG